MADDANHYEVAFGQFLHARRVPTIHVDETRRFALEDEPLKSLDFVVAAPGAGILLIDIKGRRWSGSATGAENWATDDDIHGLVRWQECFGRPAIGLLVFVYLLPSERPPDGFRDSFFHQDRHYACLAIPIDTFRQHMRPRSPRWRTFGMPRACFRSLARPFTTWLDGTAPSGPPSLPSPSPSHSARGDLESPERPTWRITRIYEPIAR